MKLYDPKVKKFISEMFLFSDRIRIYEEDTTVLTKASTIFISGDRGGINFNVLLLRSKIKLAELVILDISNCKIEIQKIWQDSVS